MNRRDRRIIRSLPPGVLAIELDRDTRERLATLAAQRGCTIADLVRGAVDCALDGMMDRASAGGAGTPWSACIVPTAAPGVQCRIDRPPP